jgi:hypothetical protein
MRKRPPILLFRNPVELVKRQLSSKRCELRLTEKRWCYIGHERVGVGNQEGASVRGKGFDVGVAGKFNFGQHPVQLTGKRFGLAVATEQLRYRSRRRCRCRELCRILRCILCISINYCIRTSRC